MAQSRVLVTVRELAPGKTFGRRCEVRVHRAHRACPEVFWIWPGSGEVNALTHQDGRIMPRPGLVTGSAADTIRGLAVMFFPS